MRRVITAPRYGHVPVESCLNQRFRVSTRRCSAPGVPSPSAPSMTAPKPSRLGNICHRRITFSRRAAYGGFRQLGQRMPNICVHSRSIHSLDKDVVGVASVHNLGVRVMSTAWKSRRVVQCRGCPTDCPITPVFWLLLVPLRRNCGKQNAR